MKNSLLEMAQQGADSYRPNDAVLNQLKTKTFIALVGPAGVGKSTTGDIIMELDPEFGRTGSVTTRRPEPRDNPLFYRYISWDEAQKRIDNRMFVNYVIHPTTNALYGTDPDMYDHPYTMLEALPETLHYFKGLPFKNVCLLYLVTDSVSWQAWFNGRYNVPGPERTKRLREAIDNLAWSLSSKAKDITFIYNPANHQEQAAKEIIQAVKYNNVPSSARKYAEEMLATAKEMT